jgi:hypothetical protein
MLGLSRFGRRRGGSSDVFVAAGADGAAGKGRLGRKQVNNSPCPGAAPG